MTNIFGVIHTFFLRFIQLFLVDFSFAWGDFSVSLGGIIIVFLVIVFVLDTVLNLR